MTSPTGRSLFPPYFLEDGIRARTEWKNFDASALREFKDKMTPDVAVFSQRANPGESETEHKLIRKALDLLGWQNAYLNQQRADGEIPDALLFPDSESCEEAARKPKIDDRYPLGIAVMENKKWNCRLDRAGDDGRRTPSTQILGYLTRAEVLSNRRILWGILTNGRLWRLYYQLARSRSEEYFECDICDALKSDDELKIFMLMFRRESFLPDVGGLTFHQSALEESRKWEARVTGELSEVMLLEVLPILAREMGKGLHDLNFLREVAMTLLFRLLFVLYAEDRGLLPVPEIYSLNKMRDEIADHLDNDKAFPEKSRYFGGFSDLCDLIDKGEKSLNLPPYNGGLFSPLISDSSGSSGLTEMKRGQKENAPPPLPDSVFAPLIDLMSRRDEDGKRRRINFSNLSVQHLGNIYERLLEREFFINPVGDVGVRLNRYARKGSGGYYTPEKLVHLIIERTLAPLLEERRARFREKIAHLKETKKKDEAQGILQGADPALAFLNLKVCDPAMGSGHFLVSLVDYLADQILMAMDEAESDAGEFNYKSPMAQHINSIRTSIQYAAEGGGWQLNQNHLDDRQLVRRMILKRVIFGVDKNPMAVELAKVSLWLHTFTVGAPLSFLDHHLLCSDSLFGEWTDAALQKADKMGGPLYLEKVRQRAQRAAHEIGEIEKTSDATIGEVEMSAISFRQFGGTTDPHNSLLNIIHRLQWLDAYDEKLSAKERRERRNNRNALAAHFLKRGPGPTFSSFKPYNVKKSSKSEEDEFQQMIYEDSPPGHFLHWDVAFPSVWRIWDSDFDGGFDAVIGNPPWDRMKLQRIEWFAERDRKIALLHRAEDRKQAIAKIISEGGKLADDFIKAESREAAAMRVARTCGEYPLLGGGDINLYSLFVERATHLINKKGMVGLLTPSGIYGDKTASEFFRKISTGGQLHALIDFENRAKLFPDVDSRFKFCALIMGGKPKKEPAELAFYLHDVEEIKERRISLAPDDFARVNPNTGNAPIFRNQRDADLTLDIYRRLPVLVNHDKEPIFPIRYFTMFHMTNDSNRFKNSRELEEDGFYPVSGNFYKRGNDKSAPLYEGKMIWHFDHRASSIAVNPDNPHHPSHSQSAAVEQKENPNWLPIPQFWVSRDAVWPGKSGEAITIPPFVLGFRHITNPTNERTIVSALIPPHGFGNSLPLLLPNLPDPPPKPTDEMATDDLAFAESERESWEEKILMRIRDYQEWSPLLCANLNSFALDFVTRQKMQGQNLNLYIIEQLPVIPPDAYKKKIGDKTAAAIVRDHVLRLSYAAEDMRPFAISQGCKADPFKWDDKIRRHLRARLDALYFILYGISREDAEYILSTFPIVKRNDEKNHGGRYLTRDLILRYISALSAGDYQSEVDELS